MQRLSTFNPIIKQIKELEKVTKEKEILEHSLSSQPKTNKSSLKI